MTGSRALLLFTAACIARGGPGPTAWARANASCQDGWTEFENMCYVGLVGHSANQSEAAEVCSLASPGAVLPSIHDMETNAKLLEITGHTAFWTGLTNFTGDGAGSWSWADGSNTDFFYWRPGMPQLGSGRQNCVWLYEGDGTWSNAQCNLNLGGVVCQLQP